MLYWLLDVSKSWLDARGLYGLFSVLDQLQFRALAAAFLAFTIVIVLGRPTIRWLLKQKIGDSGATDAEALRAHAGAKANVPTMGGVLIVGAILLASFLLADIRQFYVYLGLVVVVWHAVLGAFDDWLKLTARRRGSGSRQGLYAWEKLIFQLGIGLLVGYFAYKQGAGPTPIHHVLNLPFQKTWSEPGTLNPSLFFLGAGSFVLLSTLVIAGMSNAVNITDGMDGLAGGVAGIVCTGVFVITLIAGDQGFAQYLLVPHIPGSGELAVLAWATAGACLGFLWYNCSPAAVFMGDTGALSLGGILGYIAVVTRQEFVVLLMSGVFVLEIASVVIQVSYFKATGGKRIFRVAPFHHHLHLGGWPEQQIVARLWIASIILVVIALASIKIR
jgi:phospho-N-acetylmuramoyl-pentapeptide-transferase